MTWAPRRASRASSLALLALLAPWLVLSCSRPRPAIRNVLLISIDTLRADHLGAYGFPRPTTPNIDALAREGVLFTERPHPRAHDPARPRLHADRHPAPHPRLARQPREPAAGGEPDPGRDAQGPGLHHRGHRQHLRARPPLRHEPGLRHLRRPLPGRAQDRRPQRAQGRRDDAPGAGLAGRAQGPALLPLRPLLRPPRPLRAARALRVAWKEHPYEGEVAFADHCVGQVLEKLRQLGLYDERPWSCSPETTGRCSASTAS